MPAILNMSESLLAQGRELYHAYRYEKALFLLRGLLRLPDLKPAVAAEANFLVAQIHFRQNQLDRARTNLDEALALNPEHAESHYLLAQVIESEQATETADSMHHFEKAYRLAPKDARKRSAYALRLAKHGDAGVGLGMLHETYAEESSDPKVVADFVEGLAHAARYDDAELVVRQASYRHGEDKRFGEIRSRYEHRRRNDRLFGRNTNESEPTLLPFRNLAQPMASTDEPPRQEKPRSSRKPSVPESKPPRAVSPSSPAKPANLFGSKETDAYAEPLPTIAIGGDLTLAEVLKEFGSKYTARIYECLGLLGKTAPRAQIAQITAALMQPAFMASLIRRLPRASRRALKSVVEAGGYLPMNVLFQNAGKWAPPADYIQPLIHHGILYLGHDPKATERMVAVVPVDLLHRIAGILRVRLDETDSA